jgi:signal transduction histidine kinase
MVEQKELAFFGKIAAGVTHEIRNVLAIINESNGLMSDLLTMAKDSPFPNKDRFLRSILKIEAQVRRGVEITGKFNRFAHSVDNPIAKVDLNEIVEQSVALARRFAGLKNIELRASISGRPVLLVTSPFLLQMVLTGVVEAGITYLPAGGAIAFEIDSDRERPTVIVNFDIPGGPDLEMRGAVKTLGIWQDVVELAAQLGATIAWSEESGGIGLSLPTELQETATGQSGL